MIVLIIVGPGRLPDTGAAIGKALRGFKDAVEGPQDSQATTTQQPVQPQYPIAPQYPVQQPFPAQQPYAPPAGLPPAAAPPYAPPAGQPAPLPQADPQSGEPPRQG